MASILGSPLALQVLYAGNAMWHTSALVHFGFRQEYMMRKLALRKDSLVPAERATPEGDKWHHDLMSYLGGMNSSLALLAILRLYTIARPSRFLSSSSSGPSGLGGSDVHLDILALTVLGLANCSQAFLNFGPSRVSGRWIVGRGLDRITVLDALFTVLDWGVVVAKVASIW